MRNLQTLLSQTKELISQNKPQDVHNRISPYALIAAYILGGLALVASVPPAIIRTNWIYLALSLFIFFLLLVIYALNSIPPSIKTIIIVTFIFGLGFRDLLVNGLSGDGRILMIAGIFLAAILIRNLAGIIAFILCFVFFALLTFLMTIGQIPVPASTLVNNSGKMGEWISETILFMVSSGLPLLAFILLIKGLDDKFKKQSNLSQALENQSGELAKTVAQRTLDLEYRLGQLRTAAEISRLIGNNLDPQHIMEQMTTLLQERFDLYYVGVFIIDDLGKNAVLKIGTGDAGCQMIAQHHKLAVGGASMIGWAISNRKARISLDVGVEAIRFNNPFLPLTRSEMALPLISRDQPIGAISLQSNQPEAFDEDDITVLQGIADIFATALDNAHLYQEAQTSLGEIKNLHRRYLEQAWAQTIQSEGDMSFTYEADTPSKSTTQYKSIVIPITLRDQKIAQLILDIDQEQLSADDLVFVDTLTSQTAQALENARLLKETQRQVSQEKLLNQMTTKFNAALEVDDIIQTATMELGKMPNVIEASIILSTPEIDPIL